MKKSLIAAAGASVAAVAMPAVSVFATTTTTLQDTVTVNIVDSCTMVPKDVPHNIDENGVIKETYDAKDLQLGLVKSEIGNTAGAVSGDNQPAEDKGSIQIACSTGATAGANTWKLSVKGENGSVMEGKSGDAVGHSIATGTATTGNDATWAFKVVKISGANSNYESYSSIPTSAAVVAQGSGAAEYKMRYQVYAGMTTALGTYEGVVTYTLVNPAE